MRRAFTIIVLALVAAITVPQQVSAADCRGNSGQQVDGSGKHHKDSSACK